MEEKHIGVLRAVLIGLLVVSGAIAVPVLCRPFYYLHIAPLELTDAVGLSLEQIKAAYSEMMNYCIGLSDTFSVGALPFSQEGAAHFADVRKLFVLDLRVFFGSAVLLIASAFCIRKKPPVRLTGHTPGFWGAVGVGVTFVTVGALAALDFDRAFVVFHELFFPGKSNWLFDGRRDPVIYMLPDEFFRNCAILILALILLSCGALLAYDFRKRRTTA